MKVRLAPLYFTEINEREQGELQAQMELVQKMYGDVAEFLPLTAVGQPLPEGADAILFPQMIFAAFRHDEELKAYDLPIICYTKYNLTAIVICIGADSF